MAPRVWVGLVDWSCHLWRSFAEERCSLGRRGRRYEPGPGSSEYAAAMAVPSDSAGPEGLLGRSAEFDRLRALRRTGASSLVLVSGEAGVGKSALVNAFAAECRRAGTRVLWGGAGPASERLGVLRQPARALGIALPDVDASVGPSEQEWELTDVLAAVLLDLRSGLVVLEDLHWADGSSLAVITALSARLVGSGVMLLGTTRPQSSLTADGSDRLWRGADVLRLGSLDDVAVAALCERWSGEAPSSTEVAVLRRRTGGNPLLVREVVVAGGDVSRSVVGMDVLVSSVERFGLEIADMLGVLAVAGSLRGLALVAGLSGVTVDELNRGFDAARSGEVLVADSFGGCWFRHDLLAEAARQRLGHERCREVHLAIAEQLTVDVDPYGRARVEHLAAAVPLAEPASVAASALDCAARLLAARRPGDAVDVLGLVLRSGVVPELVPVVRARFALALGDACERLGDHRGAASAYELAAAEVEKIDDVAVLATIEVRRRRSINLLVPDPAGRYRLAELDEALDKADSNIRVELLGRRAIFALQPPADRRSAAALTAAAVAMARRLGDPTVVLGALRDEYFVGTTTRAQLEARSAVADEAIELARRAGRPEDALIGHEWRFAARLERGDLAGATRALEELEAMAAVSPSPRWGLSAAVRGAVVIAFEGDRDGSLAMVERAAEWCTLALDDEMERVGLELALRQPIAMLYGITDPAFDGAVVHMRPFVEQLTSPFLQVRLATFELQQGDSEGALRRAHRWLARPESAFEGPTPLLTLALMSRLVTDLGLAAFAAPLAAIFEEFTGLLPTDIGHSIELPVDFHLAGLSLLVGDVASATRLANAAVLLAQRMPSPPLEARCLQRLAEVQHATGDTGASNAARAQAQAVAEPLGLVLTSSRSSLLRPDASNNRRCVVLRADGPTWRLDAPDGAGVLPELVGIEHLCLLVGSPSQDFRAVDLAGMAGPPAANDLGPALDARAKREYRNRINELRIEIDDADDMADIERAAQARLELDFVIDQLRLAAGLGGRDRPTGSGAERARINVSRNLRRAIAAIERIAPVTGKHLALSIRTGLWCRYEPDPSSNFEWKAVRSSHQRPQDATTNG